MIWANIAGRQFYADPSAFAYMDPKRAKIAGLQPIGDITRSVDAELSALSLDVVQPPDVAFIAAAVVGKPATLYRADDVLFTGTVAAVSFTPRAVSFEVQL